MCKNEGERAGAFDEIISKVQILNMVADRQQRNLCYNRVRFDRFFYFRCRILWIYTFLMRFNLLLGFGRRVCDGGGKAG